MERGFGKFAVPNESGDCVVSLGGQEEGSTIGEIYMLKAHPEGMRTFGPASHTTVAGRLIGLGIGKNQPRWSTSIPTGKRCPLRKGHSLVYLGGLHWT